MNAKILRFRASAFSDRRLAVLLEIATATSAAGLDKMVVDPSALSASLSELQSLRAWERSVLATSPQRPPFDGDMPRD